VQNALCWPLTPDNELYERIERARSFWHSWDTGITPWEILRDKGLETLEKQLGKHHSYYAIDGGKWPPKGITRLSTDEGHVLVTIGVALRPQPCVELYTEDPSQLRRFELALCLSKEAEESLLMSCASYISGLANLPWASFSWYGQGHTVPCSLFPPEHGIAALLFNKNPPGVPKVALGKFMGDPINLLWLIPITAAERAFARQHGSSPLMEKLQEAGVTWAYRQRASTVDFEE